MAGDGKFEQFDSTGNSDILIDFLYIFSFFQKLYCLTADTLYYIKKVKSLSVEKKFLNMSEFLVDCKILKDFTMSTISRP